MNIVAASEVKRRGVSVLEELLQNGPVHILRHNRPVCVVLTEEDYQRTKTRDKLLKSKLTGIPYLLAKPATGKLSPEEIDNIIEEERNSWGDDEPIS